MIEDSITPLDKLISEFRLLNAKDSVTPQSLGYILHRLALAVRDANVDPDLNLGLLGARLDDVIADHNILETWVTDRLQNLPKDSAMPRLFCESDGWGLYLRNADQYLDAGYIPFLLRPTSKHKVFHVKSQGGVDLVHDQTIYRGWHQMFSRDYVFINREENNLVEFHTRSFSGAIQSFALPQITLKFAYRKNYAGQRFRVPVISWGKNSIDLAKRATLKTDFLDPEVKWRTIRLPFAIAFAKPDFNHNAQSVTSAHIVSNLATFSVLFPGQAPGGSLDRPYFFPILAT